MTNTNTNQIAPELQAALDAIDKMPANCPKSCTIQPDGSIAFSSLHKFFKCWINQTFKGRKLVYPQTGLTGTEDKIKVVFDGSPVSIATFHYSPKTVYIYKGNCKVEEFVLLERIATQAKLAIMLKEI
jgi:hypothetical protein